MLVFFSIVFVILSLIIVVYSIFKGPLLNLMSVITIPYIYLLRPIAILALQRSLLYKIDIELYKIGFFLASLSLFIYNLGYLITFPRLSKLKKNFKGLVINLSSSDKKTLRWILIFSIIFVIAMFSIGGLNVLGPNRNASMTALFPVLRYIYPFVQVGAALIGFYGTLVFIVKKDKLKGFLLMIISFVLTSIVYQRGMTIGAISTAFFLSLDNIRLTKSKKRKLFEMLRILILFFLLFLLGVFLRDIFNFIVNGFSIEYLYLRSNTSNAQNDFIIFLLSRPDGDKLEVWSILMEYLQKREPLLGKTLLRIPFMLTSSNFRLKTNLKTGVDILNEYYQYETYWYKKFGFNLDTSQELVLNFGFVGVFYNFFIGILNGILVKRFYQSINRDGKLLQEYIIFYGVSYFLGTFAAFQWLIFSLLLLYILKRLEKINFKIH